MEAELEFMYSNKVWELIEAPEGIKHIGCKWVYKRKIGVDGNDETYNARLVTRVIVRNLVSTTKKPSYRYLCSSPSEHSYLLQHISTIRYEKWMSRQYY